MSLVVSVRMSGLLTSDFSSDYRDEFYDLYGSLSSSGYGGHSGSGHAKDECCPLVVDFLCLLAIVTSIAGAALFLNQVGQIRELQEKNW